MYLVDTNILSEGSPTRRQGPAFAAVADWLDTASAYLFLSVVTVAEIEDGAAREELKGATRKAVWLRQWLEAVEHLYGARILPMDADVARVAGRLSAVARAAGAAPGFADAVIAATAKVHSLVVVTRNARHFGPMGVDFLNPYDGLPVLHGKPPKTP